MDYANRATSWQFHFAPSRNDGLFAYHRPIDGVITDMGSPEYNEAVARLTVPTVVVGDWLNEGQYVVGSDDVAVGALAVRHFRQLGLRHVVFYGPVEHPFARDRERGMREAALAEGLRVPDGPWHYPMFDIPKEYLGALPKPCGVLAASSPIANQFLTMVRQNGMRVPEDLVVLGVDEDPVLCQYCSPPLSAIDQGSRQIGYEAAALLDRLLRGERPEKKRVLIAPIGVVSRQSTELLAVDREEVAAALRYIREFACDGISTRDVLRQVPVARRTLEVAFRKCLGRSIRDEILRVRLERAKYLLRTTHLSRFEIAVQCGFSSPEKLSSVFRQKIGQTCVEFRKSQA